MSDMKQKFLEDLESDISVINSLYTHMRARVLWMKKSELNKGTVIEFESMLEMLSGFSKKMATENWRLSAKNAKLVEEIEELKKQISEKEEIAL